jgi:hypothetical protein
MSMFRFSHLKQQLKLFSTVERDRGSDNPLQIVFTIHGGKDLEELELPHLDGYKGQKPVRIGNVSKRWYPLAIVIILALIQGAADHLQV